MICAFDECSNNFEPQRHNQKYCCSECCKDATNKRIRQKYYETKERLNGSKRICVSKNCNTIMSRYTEEDICNKCIAAEKEKERSDLVRIFNG
jgi:hypothetical protein